MNNPLVSVLLSVYNGEKYLAEAIESILNQTYINFEFIIINDGSTDKSLEIIEKYKKLDARIIVISRENRGLIESLNEGIRKAKGKYIARMDADDISVQERFQKQIDIMNLHKEIGICGTGAIVFGDEVRRHRWLLSTEDKALGAQMLFSSPLIHPSVMMRKDLIERYDLYYDKNFYGAEDFELWTRFTVVAQMVNIPEALLYYRIVPNSASREADRDKQNRYQIISRITEKMVSRLEMTQTPEEHKLHFLLSTNVHMQREPIAFDNLLAYFSKIVDANQKINLYDEIELKKVFGKKWLWNIIYSKDMRACFSSYTFYGIWSLLSK